MKGGSITPKIVVVEDNPADAKTLCMALQRHETLDILVFSDGAKAIEYFAAVSSPEHQLPCDLVLLDLNMPRVSGFEVLLFLKTSPALKKLPVVVLSGSSSFHDIDRCYDAGANSYICKPAGIEQVFDMGAQLVSYWVHHVQSPARRTLTAL